MEKPKVSAMAFSRIYPMYVQKAEKKGRTKDEVDEIIFWLTGYDPATLQEQLDAGADIEAFFARAPRMNPYAARIKGVVCGCRVEEIADPVLQKIRWLDKLVDELAQGKPMDRILRK